MKRLLRGAALALVVGAGNLALGACTGTCGFGGAPTIFEPVVSAQFAATVSEAPGTAFPWLDADGTVDVVIDREADIVVVTYERDGALVKESWRVTGSR